MKILINIFSSGAFFASFLFALVAVYCIKKGFDIKNKNPYSPVAYNQFQKYVEKGSIFGVGSISIFILTMIVVFTR